MLLTSVRDDENNIWNRKTKNKDRKEQRVTEAIVKIWLLNDFVVCLAFLSLKCKASLIFKLNLES